MTGSLLARGVSTTLFVRHGTTTWNETGRIQGWAPARLSERGRAEAEAVAEGVAADRVVAAADDLGDRDGIVVAVTHLNPIRILVGERRGLPLVRSLTEITADNCSVTEIDADGTVVRENATGFIEQR